MTDHNATTTFEDLCEKHNTWVISYRSAAFDPSIFLVWYTDTDENNTDRLLTFKTGEIFAVQSLTNLKSSILDSKENLKEFENLKPWLNDFDQLEVSESLAYNLSEVAQKIESNNLDDTSIEGFANFVDLYTDFVLQDDRNTPLKTHVEQELIKELWYYYYEMIFWPRFNNKEKFDGWDRPALIIDATELGIQFSELMYSFEKHIHCVR